MTRLPGYRRGSFVLRLFVFALLLAGGIFGASESSDRRVARASTPVRVQSNNESIARGDALTHEDPFFHGDALTHEDAFFCGDALTNDEPLIVEMPCVRGDALTHDDAVVDDMPIVHTSVDSSHHAAPFAKLDTIVPGLRTFLEPNYPNPVRTNTKIYFSVAREVRVTIRIYDYFYNQMGVIFDMVVAPGRHRADFDTRSAGLMFSGMYFYEMQAGGERFVQRMMVIK
ncbi:MAG: T9SS type A sorting domain-containing protein [bacterium]|nr:T9SS type A sorting domain-containing protein [Candidatus Kapabacteria bacterium]